MNPKPTRGLFITGTGTGVGKTYVACLIAESLARAGLRVGVYKPVASGCRLHDGAVLSDDALALWNAAGRPGTLPDVCPQAFLASLAPHLAARAEQKEVDADLLIAGARLWKGRCDVLLVEGAGGLMSPVTDELYAADLAAEFGYPLVVVSPNVLGMINATLQTLITAATFREGLDVAGVVLNDVAATEGDASAASNRRELELRCVPPFLAHVAWQQRGFEPAVDWAAVAVGV
jgi:dethiobiotin synthetase